MMPTDYPPEIWIKILNYLPKRSLTAVCTLSSSFYVLSSLLLYRTFEYRPKTDTYDPKTNSYGSLDDHVDRELARLAFWSSDKLSPNVRACNISHAGYTLIPMDHLVYLVEAPTPLAEALFNTISCFWNLRNLSLDYARHSIRVPARQLAALSNLEKLHIAGGLLFDEGEQMSTSPKISVLHFSYLQIPLWPLRDSYSRSSYLSLLNPATLLSLELSAGPELEFRRCIPDPTTMASFRNLKSLSLTLTQPDFYVVHCAIAPFPAIQEIILDVMYPREGDLTTVPPTPLAPHLQRHSGPASFLPLVLRGSHPIQLSVTHGSVPKLLSTLIRSKYDANSVKALAIRITMRADVCDGNSLQELLSLFPHLQRLAIHVSSDEDLAVPSGSEAHTASQVCSRVAKILASVPTLRSVVFRWRPTKRKDEEIVPDLLDLTAQLHREVNPDLEVIFSKLSGGRFGLSN
ncbi:hypothetical protein C8R45DRAFT_1030427 [Mycena sanguinolenta]|nr:hypothetical protein C8R45DRAFT_1030427 [Mycena sanguinolenta]